MYSKCAILCFMVSSLLMTVGQVHAQEVERELLGDIIRAIDSNKNAIHTWQGEVRIEEVRLSDDGTPEVSGYAGTEFFRDTQTDRLLWHHTLYERIFSQYSTLNITPENPLQKAALVTEGIMYHYSPSRKGDAGNDVNTLNITNRADWRINTFNGDMDPMWFLGINEPTFTNNLKHYYDNVDLYIQNPAVFSIERVGDLVTLKTSTEKSHRTQFDVFDLSQGGNLVDHISHSNLTGIELHKTWDYAQVNGIWVPDTFEYSNHLVATGDPQVTMTFNFANHQINAPIADAVFSLDELEIAPDTRVTDTIELVSYTYGE